ncbi:DUF4870 domain-containing protein [Kineococcus rhizosphaerae]|uniref:Tic20 family protein n=1 Tax=Kineococcus rhizosphaerae TaxID=559628 RepID=A0A2T0R7Y6_9ACTN|nr:DUF4870 domain-containing protein [Kineococcus rhizosphaerae]PRY17262.1 hypothetical protein CLV37_102221 [Kineococcus rhizosphaerae]
MSQPPHPPQNRPPYPPQHHAPAPLSPSDERMWGMFAHLSAIAASFVTLPPLGPLIVFLVFKDRSGFVRGHSAEALNMTISLVIYEIGLFVVCSVLALVTFGLAYVLMVVPGVLALVFTILGAVAANQGRVHRYPLIIRMVR